ncbi:MAG: hypothetical protein AUJ12_00055 [Alphaproteobacteria bacterium CG1_02_46_17]|nr:MAG: hypothetical protein AUJ12_00055 [Alphaproteobacteria bacterium CG1_02_46_17]
MSKFYVLTMLVSLALASPAYADCLGNDPRCGHSNGFETYDQERQRIEAQQYNHSREGGTIGSYEQKYGLESPPAGTDPFPGYNRSANDPSDNNSYRQNDYNSNYR